MTSHTHLTPTIEQVEAEMEGAKLLLLDIYQKIISNGGEDDQAAEAIALHVASRVLAEKAKAWEEGFKSGLEDERMAPPPSIMRKQWHFNPYTQEPKHGG